MAADQYIAPDRPGATRRTGSGHVRQAEDPRHAPYGSTGCSTPHPVRAARPGGPPGRDGPSPARSPPRHSRGALSAVRRSLHPKPMRGEGKGVKEGLGAKRPQPLLITSPPREAPRPQRGAPDRSSGPCARGAAEGPCDSFRSRQALPCRGLLRSVAECAAKGGFARVGVRRRVETDCQGP